MINQTREHVFVGRRLRRSSDVSARVVLHIVNTNGGGNGANEPGHETATAVRTNVAQQHVDTICEKCTLSCAPPPNLVEIA